jgi:3-oxoadipate enol-lactonase
MNANIIDVNLYYEIHGRGDPLMMIQGWGIDITGWETIVEPLSKMFQVVVFDNRGTGRSEATPGDYTIHQLADDAAALLDHLKIENAHVLGWSMGGMIAQELALAYPNKVDRLSLAVRGIQTEAVSFRPGSC